MIPPIICSSMAGNCRRCCFGGCSSLSLSGVSSGSPLVPSTVEETDDDDRALVCARDVLVRGVSLLPARPPPCRRRRPHRFFGTLAADVLDRDVAVVVAVTATTCGAGGWLLQSPTRKTNSSRSVRMLLRRTPVRVLATLRILFRDRRIVWGRFLD